MDGDDKGSCGTAVCDAGTVVDAGDEAVASGDVAPAPVDDPAADDSVPDDLPPDSSSPESDDPVAKDSVPDDPAPGAQACAEDGRPPAAEAAAEAATEPEVVEPEVVEVASTDPAPDADPVTRTRRLRPYLRRGALALVAAGFVAVGGGAFAWIAPSPEAANRSFVEAAESKGHVVAPGEQESLVVSAARKICDRRVVHETDRERRATALTSDEIAAVGAAFGAETRDFTTLALKTFCGS